MKADVMTARDAYVAGRDARARDLAHAERRARTIGNARLAVALVALGLVVADVWGPLGSVAWWGVGACVAIFAALVVVHARLEIASERAAAALRFHVRGLARLDDASARFPNDGARFASESHPYTDDLDVFGRASLFQRIDATETRFGEERLASWLAAAHDPIDPSEIRARQLAVKDLAPRLAFRERLASEGRASDQGEAKPDPAPFVAWAEGGAPLPSLGLLTLVARALPALVVAGAIASRVLHLTNALWAAPFAVELVVIAATSRFVTPIVAMVSATQGTLARFGGVLAAIESEPFDASSLRELRATLRATGADSTQEMARLERVVSFLEARNNEVWRLFIGPVLLWDLSCAIALEKWRLRAGARVRAWLDVIGTTEALASLAGLAFEAPESAFPTITDAPSFVAKGLAHPLLAENTRVANDVTLAAPGTALVVTGSNMSGKSTLLRAIGVNAVLALAGGPVCAKELAIGPVRVATSLRVRDSLSEGVSRFYAEVRKLKTVLESARASRVPATLFLLDEVLSGTNSRERLIGARAIVRELVACGALGAVSTHDLALHDLEAELPGAIANVHFEEQVTGDRMTFDYVLRPGVVKSSTRCASCGWWGSTSSSRDAHGRPTFGALVPPSAVASPVITSARNVATSSAASAFWYATKWPSYPFGAYSRTNADAVPFAKLPDAGTDTGVAPPIESGFDTEDGACATPKRAAMA